MPLMWTRHSDRGLIAVGRVWRYELSPGTVKAPAKWSLCSTDPERSVQHGTRDEMLALAENWEGAE